MTQPDMARVRGNIAFLRSAADYFRKRPINGEDMAHWANTFDAQNCHAAADTIEALTAERDRLREALKPFARHQGKDNSIVVLKVGEDTWTGTLSTDHFAAARAALNGEPS